VELILTTLYFRQCWHFFYPDTLKLVDKENKSEENAIKTGYIAGNIDIYSLLWQKMINFACVLF
jgi:hypothetical protein